MARVKIHDILLGLLLCGICLPANSQTTTTVASTATTQAASTVTTQATPTTTDATTATTQQQTTSEATQSTSTAQTSTTTPEATTTAAMTTTTTTTTAAPPIPMRIDTIPYDHLPPVDPNLTPFIDPFGLSDPLSSIFGNAFSIGGFNNPFLNPFSNDPFLNDPFLTGFSQFDPFSLNAFDPFALDPSLAGLFGFSGPLGLPGGFIF